MSILFSSGSEHPRLLVGTYTESEGSTSEGIYVYSMNPSSGELIFESLIRKVPNISYMEVHPLSGLLYAVSETEEFDGQPGGGVNVLSRDATGQFHILHKQSSGGANPAYISIEKTGRFALVANYKGGSIAMLPIGPDGSLSPASDVVQHVGSGPHPERQDGPHPHCIRPDPTNRFALAADLGTDKIMIYQLDLEAGKFHSHGEVAVEARAGPRHILFDATGRRVYLMNELNSTISLFSFDPMLGSLEQQQTVRTLPELFQERNLCGDFRFAPDQRHLYVSNRGHDSIVCFHIDLETGELTYQSHIPSNGHEPRILALDPGGRFVVAAHQKSRNVVVYRLDPSTGSMEHTGHEAQLDMPVHVLFA